MASRAHDSFAERLAGRTALVGSWLTMSDPVVAEIARDSDLSFVILDGEHAPLGRGMIDTLVGAADGGNPSVLVRVPTNSAVYIANALDAGADGVVVPQVRSAADVERAVAACRYPPTGIRGWGPRRAAGFGRRTEQYRSAADAKTAVIVQVELKEAIDDLSGILSVAGLDGVLIGPNDLAGSLGHLGDLGHPDVVAAIQFVIDSSVSRGMAVGIACGGDALEINGWFDKGCRFVAASSDYALLAQAFDRLAVPWPQGADT